MPRRIEFAEVRQRLYNKFIGQEGIPLSKTFNVVFVPPPTTNSPPAGSVALADRTDVQVMMMMMISLQSDWEHLMSTVQDNKIILRIQDDSSSTTTTTTTAT